MAAVHAPQQPRPHSPFRRAYRHPYQHKSSSSTSAAGSSNNNNNNSSSSSSSVSSAQAGAHPHAHAHAQAQSQSHHAAQASHGHPALDTYYGHEETAKLCSRFVSHTFNCPETIPPAPPAAAAAPPSSSGTSSASAAAAAAAVLVQPSSIPATLAHFVAYALHRTRLHVSVTFTALALLHRLKTRFPAARGSSGHRLFLSAFMIASKVCCDDTYSNKSWAVVGQGLFALREVNQMEREMCAYLDWQLNVPREDLKVFEEEVKRVYSRPGPYPAGTTAVNVRLVNGVGGKDATTGPYVPNEFTTPPPAMARPSAAAAPPLVPTSVEKEKNPASSPMRAHQLPTPTETGGAAVPFTTQKPQLAVNTTVPPAHHHVHHAHHHAGAHVNAMPSPPISPEDDAPLSAPAAGRRGGGSPSPASSEESDLPTPPSSAGAAVNGVRGPAGAQAFKMSKSYSLPGFAAGFGHAVHAIGAAHQVHGHGLGHHAHAAAHAQLAGPHAPVQIQVHRASVSVPPPPPSSSMPPSFQVKEVNAASSAGGGGMGAHPHPLYAPPTDEDDADTLMALDDEKRMGTAYYASVAPISSSNPGPVSSSSASQAATRPGGSSSSRVRSEKDLLALRTRDREAARGGGGGERPGRSLRTYTVPCTW